MNFIKKNLILVFALSGLVISLGAPLGYYIHDFYFNQHQSTNIFNHILYLHQYQKSTVLYIGLGSNIFFTLFGAMAGMLFQQILKQEKKLESLTLSKQNIMLHLLARMRKATTIGLEGLYYLKAGMLSEAEQTIIINETVKELKLIDENAQDLILLKEEILGNQYCSIEELITLIDVTSQKYQVSYICEPLTNLKELKIQVEPRYLVLAFDIIFEWVSIQEESSVLIKYKVQNLDFGLIFHFSLENLDESFNSHLLCEVVENNFGSCLVSGNTIKIFLPLHSCHEKKRAA